MNVTVLFLLCNMIINIGNITITLAADNVDQKLSSCGSSNHYKEALEKGILFFEGQRSGKLPPTQRARWRGDSALNDGKAQDVNLTGGYYDAGDNVKFTWPMAYTVTLLSWAAIEHQWELSSANQLEYLRSAILWATDYLLKAQDSQSSLYAQVGDGTRDHQCWERPEDMDTPRTIYKIDKKTPGTEVAAEVAAAFAAASSVFKHTSPRYADRLMHQSKEMFQFAITNKGSYQGSCPYYCSFSGYEDELLWAAAWIYKLTGEKYYLRYLTANQAWSHPVAEFSWDNKFAGVQTLMAKEFLAGNMNLSNYKTDADAFVCAMMPGSGSSQIKTTPGGLLYSRESSNIQYVTGAAMILLYYSNTLAASRSGSAQKVQCGYKCFTPAEITAFAKSQIDYILGDNPLKMSYMVGFGKRFPMQLHHRGASIPSIYAHPEKVGCSNDWYYSTMPNPNVHIGAIVGGGPNANDQFIDLRSDYSHLEPTIYTNAAFVGSLASLLGLVREGADNCLLMPHQQQNSTTTNNTSSSYSS
ncbi:OLC1v1029863C3 [Oldenlandia corymbosa var. corymbosa]|nr:OLC1v1029863C3 [Oldenlandia corymbosa var. corymbosa]